MAGLFLVAFRLTEPWIIEILKGVLSNGTGAEAVVVTAAVVGTGTGTGTAISRAPAAVERSRRRTPRLRWCLPVLIL